MRYVANVVDLRDHVFVSVFADNTGQILVSTPYAFGHMENGRFVPIRGVPGGTVSSTVARTRKGISGSPTKTRGAHYGHQRTELFSEFLEASIGHKDGAQSLVALISSTGEAGGLDLMGVEFSYFSDGQIKETYGPAEGLGSGRVSALDIDTDDAVWAATEGGLSRIKNGRVLTLTSKNGLPMRRDSLDCAEGRERRVLAQHDLRSGFRIVRGELNAWAADSQRKVKTTVFDILRRGVSNAPASPLKQSSPSDPDPQMGKCGSKDSREAQA